MSNFDNRLQNAIERGKERAESREQADAARRLNEKEAKALHATYRLQVSNHIETSLRRLAEHFPGFQFETIISEKGWGAALHREDLRIGANRRRSSLFSRIEVVVRPMTDYRVLDIGAKGTVMNRELLDHAFYRPLEEADPVEFQELVDTWAIQYAELFSAGQSGA